LIGHFSVRYYINRVKDIYRQATIDLLLGNLVTEELNFLCGGGGSNKLQENERQGLDEEDGQVLVEKEENLKTLIDECKKMLIIEPEECLGGWGLIDCDPDTCDPAQQDMDIILLLSRNAYYVAR
jgi:phosphatidylinositol 4-phosphatase